jgi:predicted RNase H-like nuclease (RuvC/YqgF family)
VVRLGLPRERRQQDHSAFSGSGFFDHPCAACLKQIVDLQKELGRVATKQQQDHENEAAVTAGLTHDSQNWEQQLHQLHDRTLRQEKEITSLKSNLFNFAEQMGRVIFNLEFKLDRLTDHVNREVGVADDLPFHTILKSDISNINQRLAEEVHPRIDALVKSVRRLRRKKAE